MTETTATTPATEKKEKGPSPVLRGYSGEKVTMALWANPEGAKVPLHGYVAGSGGKSRQVIGFFNDKAGKKSISLKEFLPGKDGAADSWSTVGFGHAVNSRKDGEKVFFDTMVFNIDGKNIGARVTKAGEEFHAKMGFTSPKAKRPKTEEDADTNADTGEASRPRQRAA